MGEFWIAHELGILRWLHILAMVYWLGGEWAVFQTSFKVFNPSLSLEERSRHMDTIFRIDVMSRVGIVSLLPLGLHMGYLWGLQPLGGAWLALMWVLWIGWITVTLVSFFYRGKEGGLLWQTLEDWSRYLMIPVLLGVAIWSLVSDGPIKTGDGQNWYVSKLLMLGILFCIGVVLRVVMHSWQKEFKLLATGPDPAAETRLDASIRFGRGVAFVYWTGIAFTGFLGAVKPF